MRIEQARRSHSTSGIDKNLTRYAVLGGAALALPIAGHASVVYSGPQNVTVDSSAPYTVNLDGSNFAFSTGVWTAFDPAAPTANKLTYGNALVDGSGYARALNAGDMIGPTGTFNSDIILSDTAGNGNFPTDGATFKYLGVEFTDPSNRTQTDYGWIQASTTVNPSETIEVAGWAYDNSGAAIAAGQTPEPSFVALLGLGAAGLALFRHRKARAEKD